MKNVVLCGMPSSGKSTVGKLLAERLGVEFFDTDAAIVKSDGRGISDIFAKEGEAYFRTVESKVIEQAARRSGVVIALGGGAVLKPENVAKLKSTGTIFFLDRALELLTPTDDRPLSSKTEALQALYTKRLPIYNQVADYTIENNGTAQQAVEKIYALL